MFLNLKQILLILINNQN